MTTTDALVFCGPHIEGWVNTVASILAAGARAGVDRHVLAPVKPRGYDLRPENERIAAIVAGDRVRFDGLIRVDPLQRDEAVREAEIGLARPGMVGLFIHPGEEMFAVDDARVDAVVAVADASRSPVFVATGIPWRSEGLQVAALAARHPDTPFLLTNGGQINISGLGMQDAWVALESTPNTIVLTNGEYRQDFIEDVASKLGPARIVFASAAPLFKPSFEVLRARWADLPASTIEAMLGGTWETIVTARGSRAPVRTDYIIGRK